MAFKLFHGKDGIVPLSGKPDVHCNKVEQEPTLQFNPLAANAATISLSAFTGGGPFGFGSFLDKWKNQKSKSDSSNMQESSSQVITHSYTNAMLSKNLGIKREDIRKYILNRASFADKNLTSKYNMLGSDANSNFGANNP